MPRRSRSKDRSLRQLLQGVCEGCLMPVGIPTRRTPIKSTTRLTLPCRSCRRLRSFDLDFLRLREDQYQKVAASDNSYRDFRVLTKRPIRPLFCWPILTVITAAIVANIYLGIVSGGYRSYISSAGRSDRFLREQTNKRRH